MLIIPSSNIQFRPLYYFIGRFGCYTTILAISLRKINNWVSIKNQAKIIVTHTDKPTVGKTVAKSLGGVVGGAIACAIDAAKGKDNLPPEWAAFFGREAYTMDDIILAVADKAQQLFG